MKRLLTDTRAFQLVKLESAHYIDEIRDMRRVHRCGIRPALARLVRLYRGAIRSSR